MTPFRAADPINGLITRIPGRNLYRLTSEGLRFAVCYTHDRLLRSLLAADQPPRPLPIRNALHFIDIHVANRIDQARLLRRQTENSRHLSEGQGPRVP